MRIAVFFQEGGIFNSGCWLRATSNLESLAAPAGRRAPGRLESRKRERAEQTPYSAYGFVCGTNGLSVVALAVGFLRR